MPLISARLARVFLSWAFTLFAVTSPILGQEKPTAESTKATDSKKASDKNDAKEKKSESDKDAPKKETIVTTKHSIEIAGRTVSYEAMAGKLPIKDDALKSKAEMFFIAYTRTGISEVGKRPVTFCFNGGPGSSSVWLHLGMLGPKRIRFPDNATPLRAPYTLEENSLSLLDVTDLVFIDPVSTGYSRPAEGDFVAGGGISRRCRAAVSLHWFIQ